LINSTNVLVLLAASNFALKSKCIKKRRKTLFLCLKIKHIH
jgi:hypothetical protein